MFLKIYIQSLSVYNVNILSEQERASLLWTWVLGTGALVIISIIVGIVIIILTNSILGAILLFVVSAVQIYFILVVRSYAIQVSINLSY